MDVKSKEASKAHRVWSLTLTAGKALFSPLDRWGKRNPGKMNWRTLSLETSSKKKEWKLGVTFMETILLQYQVTWIFYKRREEKGKEGRKEGRDKEKKIKETKPYSNVYGWMNYLHTIFLSVKLKYNILGEKRVLIHCWWDCKLLQPLWKTVWRFLKKVKTVTTWSSNSTSENITEGNEITVYTSNPWAYICKKT